MKLLLKPTAILICVCIFVSLTSCKKDLPGIPAYIKVDTISLSTDYINEGGNFHKISNIRLEIGGSDIGNFEWPFAVPVLNTGNVNAAFVANVRRNGLFEERIEYPFYTVDVQSISLTERETTVVSPVIQYVGGTVFAVNDNFDGSSSFNGDITIDNTDPFQGSGTGMMFMDEFNPSVEAVLNNVDLPGGTATFVEFDYKSENLFSIDVETNTPFGSERFNILFLKEREDWNKVYLDLSAFVSGNIVDSYNFYFKSDLIDTSSSATLLIDNFKILHF